MIRVNLISDALRKQKSSVALDILEDPVSGSSEDRQKALIKLLAILLIPVLLFGIEWFLLDIKKSELNDYQIQLNEKNQESAKYESILQEFGKFEEEKKKLETQMKVIESLSKGREMSVFALQNIQKSIPRKAWLTEISYEDKGIKFSGLGMTESDVIDFMSRIESNVYFDSPELVESIDKRTNAGIVKSFQIMAKVRNSNERN